MNNNILSRIIGRLNVEELKTFSRVVIDIGLGTFDGFEAPVAGQNRKFDEEGLIRNLDEVGQNRTFDERVSIKALDIEPSASHAILGKKLNFVEILPRVLTDVSTAFSMGGFEKAAIGAEGSLATARADARNALIIAMSLYEGNLILSSNSDALQMRKSHHFYSPSLDCRAYSSVLRRLRDGSS